MDWDLLPVVRNHVYHPTFGGSFSLKAVLPALVPDMTYEGMVVADGQDAGLAWETLSRGGLDHKPNAKISWWEYFRLCALSDDELQEDKSALGGLQALVR